MFHHNQKFCIPPPFVMFAQQLLLAVLAITLLSQYTQANQNDCMMLNVGGSTDWFPVTYINPLTGNPEGLGYTLVYQLGNKIGVPVNIKPYFPWARMMNMAREGKLDIIAGMVSTPKRAKYLHFTKPFFSETLYAYVHSNSKLHLTRVEDLQNYKRAEIRDYSMGEKLDALLAHSTVKVNDDLQRIALILSGRADYFISSPLEFSILQRKYSGLKDVKKLPLPISEVKTMLAISKASPCAKYLAKFDQIITERYPAQ